MAPPIWGDGLPGELDNPWDAGDWGDGQPLGPVPIPYGWIAEILIGTAVVWSSEESAAQQTLLLDVSGYTGSHVLKFRLRRTA